MSSALAHVDGESLRHLDEMLWISDIARVGATRFPDRVAILFADRGSRVSYQALDRQSDSFAALAKNWGLRPGDRVAYLGKNSDLFFPVLFGAIRAQIVLVPINWRLAAPEVAYQLADSGALLLICDPELVGTANAATATLSSAPEFLVTEGGNASLRSLLAQSAVPATLPHLPTQVVLQLYTSGTTGHPKGVLISHYALSVARHCELISPNFALLTPGNISLSGMPNFHVGGMSWVLMGLIRFGTVVLTANPAPGNMLALIDEYHIDNSFIVPTVIRAMIEELKSRDRPAPAIKGMFYGAMAMSESLLREAMSLFGCAFFQFFGMTEITGAATFLRPDEHDLAKPHLLRSVGKPYPGMSLEIRGPDRRVLAPEEHGEVWIRTPTCMLEYYRLPKATEDAIADGWYATGDGGYLDTEGYLYLTDRIKDMIVSGGENVYPAEVEETLRSHPSVLDAACVGVAHALWGESVVAIVELRAGQTVNQETLKDFARSRIASYKCPKEIHFIDALPRTASGKVKRAELRAGFR
jgi:acyl-CoA synthetase (AMP-forming)/AMP-acid ligase II